MSREYFICGQTKVNVELENGTKEYLGLCEGGVNEKFRENKWFGNKILIKTDFDRGSTALQIPLIHFDMDILKRLVDKKYYITISLEGAIYTKPFVFTGCALKHLQFSPGAERSVVNLEFESATTDYLNV